MKISMENLPYSVSEHDGLMRELYGGKRRWVYTVLAIVSAIIMVVSIIMSQQKIREEENLDAGFSGKEAMIVEEGNFVSGHEVYRRIKMLIMQRFGDTYRISIDGDGGLGFYEKGKSSYGFNIACMDKNNEYMEYFDIRTPCEVVYYDDEPGTECMACFIETVWEGISHEEAVDYLRNQFEGKEKEALNQALPLKADGMIIYPGYSILYKKYSLTVVPDRSGFWIGRGSQSRNCN